MIKITNISHSFNSDPVLSNFSLNIDKLTCIKSPSGSGKTTLVNILLGFIKPDKGTVEGLSENIGVLFQEDRLIMHMNAIENLMIATNKSKDECIAILDKLNVTEINKMCSELSGGTKRRVALGRALLTTSDFLILDEPFTGLDETNRLNALDIIKSQNKPTLLITHNADDINYLNLKLINDNDDNESKNIIECYK